MNRLLSSALLGGTLALAASVPANAAPPSMTPGALSTESSVQKVHRFHRSCIDGHRNTSDGDRVSCGGYYYRDSSPGITLQLNTRDRNNRRDRHDRGDSRDRGDQHKKNR